VTRKVNSRELKIGMYVDSLDRPWVETDFLFQGFLIQSEDDLESLRKQTEFVFVDEEKCDMSSSSGSTPAVPASGQHAEKQMREVKDDIKKAYIVRSKIENSFSSILKDIGMGKAVYVGNVKNTIKEMVDSLINNPDAMLLLGQIEEVDAEAASHAVNCLIIALAFGHFMGLKCEELETLGLAALLHDVGETEIPKELLDPARIKTAGEEALVRRHTELGRNILQKIEGIPLSVIDIAYSHHEQVDGQGYPEGVTSEQISLFAKIIALVDTYDRLTSAISGKMLTCSEASHYLYIQREIKFDKNLTEKFIKCFGIYPIGSLVELAKGDVGVVASASEGSHLYPRLILVLDPYKHPYYPPRLINLAAFCEGENAADYVIKKMLPRNAYGFDYRAYIRREFGMVA